MNTLGEKLKLLPESPGVYVMLDENGVIIYVGKAKNLKNRVRQYFNGTKTGKVAAMVKSIRDFYYIIAPTEIDALSLENNLIKKHKPRYNILLKDDKTYPYIKVNLKENYPCFKSTRKILKDGAKYFGPFMGGVNVKSVLEVINLAFGIRPCTRVLSEKSATKPCLNYHIKKCSAPCCGYLSNAEYSLRVNHAIDFLSGETEEVEQTLTSKMLSCAEKEDFESALKYKQALDGLEKITVKRLTALNRFICADVLAFATNGVYSAINVLFVRNGRMMGGKSFSFETSDEVGSEALREFVSAYYKDGSDVPDQIISGVEIADTRLLTEFFKLHFDKNVEFTLAKQGVKKQLADMAQVNANEYLEKNVDKINHKYDMTVSACKALQDKLGLKNYPKRMECFDISNISGVDKVGSMVVFIDGEPDYDGYRRFKITTFEGSDDFRSMQEVLSRRLDRMASDEKFPKPDLIVIDGGKGQLSSVLEVFEKKGVEGIDLISLAEREEEIFLPNQSNPIVLSKRDYCLKMLQRIRDEAHRFAITYHRSLRGKRALSSVLDGVYGLGKVKKQALLTRFKDLSGIARATKEQLMEVAGIGEVQAGLIIDYLTKEGLR
ncbi:MAG: excinuclease ABC subunit UvrC [Clostridia bacterium]|nr:excinuclease ABC subunit UvrC [Clostridia bacterium]